MATEDGILGWERMGGVLRTGEAWLLGSGNWGNESEEDWKGTATLTQVTGYKRKSEKFDYNSGMIKKKRKIRSVWDEDNTTNINFVGMLLSVPVVIRLPGGHGKMRVGACSAAWCSFRSDSAQMDVALCEYVGRRVRHGSSIVS